MREMRACASRAFPKSVAKTMTAGATSLYMGPMREDSRDLTPFAMAGRSQTNMKERMREMPTLRAILVVAVSRVVVSCTAASVYSLSMACIAEPTICGGVADADVAGGCA